MTQNNSKTLSERLREIDEWDEAKMIAYFNRAKGNLAKGYEAYAKQDLAEGWLPFSYGCGACQSLPARIESNGLTGVEGVEDIIAEATRLAEEAYEPMKECYRAMVKLGEKENKRKESEKRKRETTKLEKRLKKALHFKTELETKMKNEVGKKS